LTNAADSLQQRLGYRFARREWLDMALTHRSFGRQHNERLEFLGDGVLNFVIAHRLFEQFPEADEGQLSRLRAHLVKGATLAELARGLELGECLQLGPGERKSGGFRRDSILAGTLESLIGAVYLDGGFVAAQALIEGIYRSALAGLTLGQGFKDAKTRLQEFLQGRGLPLPEYRVLAIEGDAHCQVFKVECILAASGINTQGRAVSRRLAEQAAAQQALVALGAEEPA